MYPLYVFEVFICTDNDLSVLIVKSMPVHLYSMSLFQLSKYNYVLKVVYYDVLL